MMSKAVNAYAENGGSKYVMNKKANGTYERKKISFDSDAIESLEANALPKVTSNDNGKALIVSSGKWSKKNIPSQLPAVTDSDEGKVLAVNSSGAWVAQNPSGGGSSIFEIGFTVTRSGGTTEYTLNKTWNEIKTAILAKSPCYIIGADNFSDPSTGGFNNSIFVPVIAASESFFTYEDENNGNEIVTEYTYYIECPYMNDIYFPAGFSTTTQSGYPSYAQSD